jgi:tRNA uridine 5-carbamoylmethylation protein Kti12
VKEPKNIMMIGKRGTGKTTRVCQLIDTILTQFSKVNICVMNDDKSEYAIYSSHPKITLQYFKNINDVSITGLCSEPDTRNVVICDSYDGYIQLKKNPQLLLNGKSMNVTLCVVIQYPSVVPLIQSNMDYVFVFRDYLDLSIKKLHGMYGGALEESKFRAILTRNTWDHDVLVVHKVGDTCEYYHCKKIDINHVL